MQIKFSYLFQHLETGEIHEQIWDLDGVERTAYSYIALNASRYIVIARRLFTLVCDKNKREIYNGDIIEMTNTTGDGRTLAIVKWSEECTCFELIKSDDTDSLLKYNESDYEVVGNIYENKELVKKLKLEAAKYVEEYASFDNGQQKSNHKE